MLKVQEYLDQSSDLDLWQTHVCDRPPISRHYKGHYRGRL